MSSKENNSDLRVLLIEDDVVVEKLITFLLKRQGLHVVLATDGRHAYEVVEREPPPHAILLDIKLPYIDGFELISHIRQKPGWQSIPLLVLTADGTEATAVRVLNAGADDYIQKPFRAEELVARLRRSLRLVPYEPQ